MFQLSVFHCMVAHFRVLNSNPVVEPESSQPGLLNRLLGSGRELLKEPSYSPACCVPRAFKAVNSGVALRSYRGSCHSLR